MSVDHYSEALRHLAEADAHVVTTHRHRSCQLSALTHALLEVAVRLGACPTKLVETTGTASTDDETYRQGYLDGRRDEHALASSSPQTAPAPATGTPQAGAGAPPGGDEPDSGEAE